MCSSATFCSSVMILVLLFWRALLVPSHFCFCRSQTSCICLGKRRAHVVWWRREKCLPVVQCIGAHYCVYSLRFGVFVRLVEGELQQGVWTKCCSQVELTVQCKIWYLSLLKWLFKLRILNLIYVLFPEIWHYGFRVLCIFIVFMMSAEKLFAFCVIFQSGFW